MLCVFGILSSLATIGAAEPVTQTLIPSENITPGRSMVWTPALQACWDDLLSIYNVQGLDFNPPNQIVSFMNDFEWDSDKALPPHGMFTVTGVAGPQFVATVNQALRNFGATTGFLDPAEWPAEASQGIAVLSYFSRNVQFMGSFDDQTKAPLSFIAGDGEVLSVSAFGSVTPEQKMMNVGAGRVLHYEKEKKIAVALKTADPKEFVFLLRDPEVPSLDGAMSVARDLLNSAPAPQPADFLTKLDTLLIPKLSFSSDHDFVDQLGGSFKTPANPSLIWKIHTATQQIEFSLSSAGADMKVRAWIVPPGMLTAGDGGESAKPKIPRPRQLNFDKPFYLMFWRKEATVPYFAAYIDKGGLEKHVNLRK